MFHKALVATDLSPAANHLIDCAGELKALGVSQVTLLHVEETRFTVGLDESLAREHRPELEARAGQLREQGYEVELEVVRGVAWYEIVEAARRVAVDLIVVASHGHGALAESLLGGTAARVTEHAPAPVLVLRMGLMDQGGGRYCALRFAKVLDHVLFATDFSETAVKAFDALLDLAPEAGRVTLLHVNEEILWEHLSPQILTSFEEEDRTRLEDRVEALRNVGCADVRYEIARGNPRRVIMEYARSSEVTLIVLGISGWNRFQEVLLGSTAHALVRHASAPVLLVDRSDDPFRRSAKEPADT